MRAFRVAVRVACLVLPLSGCGGVLDPQGPVGTSEKLILFNSLAIMLAIVIPTILATIAFAWWFRASNAKAKYLPNWAFSGHLELVVWAIPTLVITFLGGIAWFGSHEIDPFAPLASAKTPIEIEVVSLDWKWLFIYPNQDVATVNQLVIPVGTPIHFRLTSSGVMNSFFVPQLGSQIYTMAGMISQVSLEADAPGDYHGLSAQFSGAGFSDMHFDVKAVPQDAFAAWTAATKTAGATLDQQSYAALAKPSANLPPASFKSVAPDLFAAIVGGAGQMDSDANRGAAGPDRPMPMKGM